MIKGSIENISGLLNVKILAAFAINMDLCATVEAAYVNCFDEVSEKTGGSTATGFKF